MEKFWNELVKKLHTGNIDKCDLVVGEKEIKIESEVIQSEREFVDKDVDTLARLKEEVKNSDFIYRKALRNLVLKEVMNCGSFTLVGGAVLDIHRGEKPKDYDFTVLPNTFLDQCTLIDTSKSSDTYTFKSETIQLLKTNLEDFDFTISTNKIMNSSFYYGNYGRVKIVTSTLPKCRSYKSKLLIPVSYKRENAINSLLRIPHWKKKGFTITDNTYRSLVVAATGQPEYMKKILGENS